jgi:hypothetical protein
MCEAAPRRGLARGAVSFQSCAAKKKPRTEVAGAEVISGIRQTPSQKGSVIGIKAHGAARAKQPSNLILTLEVQDACWGWAYDDGDCPDYHLHGLRCRLGCH